MNADTLKGQWKQLRGHVQKQWGKLTNDDLDQAEGEADILAGKIQERYGRTKEEARKEIDSWLQSQ
ncbi:MAG: CsbD family protein [bacterium]|nr:CsbD family protein [bacterium]